MRIVKDDPEYYFIDTNIAIHAVGKEHELKEPCKQILLDISEYNLPVWSNTEVLQEILYFYNTRKQRKYAIEVTESFTTVVDNILAVQFADIERALLLMAQVGHIPVRDTIHAASMLNNSLTNIVTADKHFEDIAGIRRIDPLDWREHLVQTGVVENTTTDSGK